MRCAEDAPWQAELYVHQVYVFIAPPPHAHVHTVYCRAGRTGFLRTEPAEKRPPFPCKETLNKTAVRRSASRAWQGDVPSVLARDFVGRYTGWTDMVRVCVFAPPVGVSLGSWNV